MNHMKERHLDGTVLMRQAAGGVFEPLARPDLLITDAERASVTTSRRKDRDAALMGMYTVLLRQTIINRNPRYYHRYSHVPFISTSTV